jgi:hypothetical protein
MDALSGVLVILGVAVLFWAVNRARFRRQRDDHGSVSGSWLAEQRGKKSGQDHP